VGVVKDFHVTSLHESIGPVLLQVRPSSFQYISARISTRNISNTLSFLGQKWSQFSPAFPFEYSFLDEDFDRLYRADEKVGRIIGIFSLLAILVACLGLFGLASYATEQRTKEIGIRKVLGSSIAGIVLLLSKEFTKWVLIANVIAWPIAYYAMKRWLGNFAYRAGIGLEIFIFSGFLAFAIALITVSYQSIKAALTDPVDSLRYE
jgi:putative ABC transport system permease protein